MSGDSRPGERASPVDVVWTVQTLADVPDDDEWLTRAEREQLARFRMPKRWADWRLGRWTVKRAIRASPWVAPDARVWIVAAPDGAPEAYDGAWRAPCSISISHSAGRAVAGVAPAGTRIGCDVEREEARDAGLVEDFFTARERARVAETPAAELGLAVTRIWSAKESALKLLREGLRLDTRDVEVCTPRRPARGDGWHPLAVAYRAENALFRGWWRAEDGFVITIVTSPPCRRPVRRGV